MWGLGPERAVERYRVFGGDVRSGVLALHESEETLRASVSGVDALELLGVSLLGHRDWISHALAHTRVGACAHTGMAGQGGGACALRERTSRAAEHLREGVAQEGLRRDRHEQRVRKAGGL